MDISKCFDSIDHHRLRTLLKERGLRDTGMLDLIWKGLRSRVVELGECERVKPGTPQGSVLSPLLANIFLDQIDRWLEEYSRNYTRGKRRRDNPVFRKRRRQVAALTNRHERRRGYARLREEGLPSPLMEDPGYRRMRWIRYADDILIAVAGPRREVVELKGRLGDYLATIGLTLSEEKTLITSATRG